MLFSCSEDDLIIETSNETGIVTGTIVTPNGSKVGGATIEVASNSSYKTKTNNEGEFSFSVPSGEQRLKVFSGSGDIFRTSLNVSVTIDATANIGDIVLDNPGSIAYLAGDYDNIQDIIDDSLGYSMVAISSEDLQNLNALNAYDLIFLNCGEFAVGNSSLGQTEQDLIRSNLNSYITNGGKAYGSDWAITYFAPACTVDSLEEIGINFEINNTIFGENDVCFKLIGVEQEVTANVVDANLSTLIGSTAEVNYDLPGWANIETGLSFSGNVLLSNPTLGIMAFDQSIGDGHVLFTTFHNEANITEDMEEILEYFIFNF